MVAHSSPVSTRLAASRGSPAPLDLLAPLRSNRTESGFHGVYRDENGTYRARWNKRINLNGRHQTSHAAALRLVAWLREWYGPGWERVARRTRANIGRVTRVESKGELYFLAHVFVCGMPCVVTSDTFNSRLPRREWGNRGVWKWATRSEARAALKVWLKRFRRSHGLYERYAGLWLWRAAGVVIHIPQPAPRQQNPARPRRQPRIDVGPWLFSRD